MHDPARYPEPEAFKPERFLGLDGSLLDDPVLVLVFGYGKRVCPGRHFAEATLFISVASLLSVFNVEKGETSKGQPFEYTYSSIVVRSVD
jgi:cytochrome P450